MKPTPKFCSQCGAPLGDGARFCSACGSPVGGQPAPPRGWREQLPGLAVLTAFLIAGLFVWMGALQEGGMAAATAPRPPGPPSAGTGGMPGLPSNHPPIGLAEDTKRFLEQLTAKVEAAPADASAWTNLAQVQARAAVRDPSYGPRAAESFRHVLNLTPDDADTIRALANILYDQRKYEDASMQYERYLELRPDDPGIRTDLATTYLYRRELDRAIATYQQVIETRPDFLQAHFNLGLAYVAQGDHARALAAIAKARSLAKDDQTRERIDRVVAELAGRPAPGNPQAAAPQPPQQPPGTQLRRVGSAAPGTADAASYVTPPASYRAAVEQQLRAHSILGRKIARIEWPDDTRVRVLVHEFPMDAMPDSARNLFRGRLETIIDDAKEQFEVEGEHTIELIDAASGTVIDRATQ